MKLAEIISADRVSFRSDVHSKKRALEEISRLLASGDPALAESEILSSLASREKLGSTGLGGGVAIPHGRLHGISHSVGAFMRIEGGVDYEASDGLKVDLVFGLVVPQDCTQEHLKILAALAELFLDEGFCAAARGARDARELHQLLLQHTPAAAA